MKKFLQFLRCRTFLSFHTTRQYNFLCRWKVYLNGKINLQLKTRIWKKKIKGQINTVDNIEYTLCFVFRLLMKTEDLEYLMNDEVSDINEMLKVVNNIQVNKMWNRNQKWKFLNYFFLQNGKQNCDMKSLKRFVWVTI